ncbi:hypothetical protein [Pseudomonas sp. VI4.1]|uniref:hypothetical protein n=1 Tax=Pseudomonas sp. VI4.1 TaxID=1941346 RepID=UPI00353188EC
MISAACDFVFLNSHEHIHSMTIACKCFFHHLKTLKGISDELGSSGPGALFEAWGVRADAFASKPAPTLNLLRTQKLCTPKIQCGSGPAREGALIDCGGSKPKPIHRLRQPARQGGQFIGGRGGAADDLAVALGHAGDHFHLMRDFIARQALFADGAGACR